MKKIVSIICLLAFSQLSEPQGQAMPHSNEPPLASVKAAVTPLTFPQYQSLVSKVDLKSHTIRLGILEKLLGKPELVVLDLRSAEEYGQGHIKGAISFGADISKEKLEKFVPDKKATVVIYCTNNFFPSRRLSLNFASLPQMLSAGYANTFILEDLWQSTNFSAVSKFKEGPLWEPKADNALPESKTECPD